MDDGGAEIGAEHEEGAMGEIGDAHQAEGQRKARRQQEQQSAERNAVQSLDDPELHRTAARVTPAKERPRETSSRGRNRFKSPIIRGCAPAGSRANRPAVSGTHPYCMSRTGWCSDKT